MSAALCLPLPIVLISPLYLIIIYTLFKGDQLVRTCRYLRCLES
jgi:hypothetical protein